MGSTVAPAHAEAQFRWPDRRRRPCGGSGRGRECRAGEAAGRQVGGFRGEPVRKQPYLPAQALRALVVWKKFAQSSLKTLAQLGSKKDERKPGLDLRGHALEDFGQVGAAAVRRPEVVKRPAAADVLLGDFNLEARGGENRFSGGEVCGW